MSHGIRHELSSLEEVHWRYQCRKLLLELVGYPRFSFREYRDLNPENIQSAIKEHQALSKDVIQSIKAAGCVDVFFSAEPEPTVKDEYV